MRKEFVERYKELKESLKAFQEKTSVNVAAVSTMIPWKPQRAGNSDAFATGQVVRAELFQAWKALFCGCKPHVCFGGAGGVQGDC